MEIKIIKLAVIFLLVVFLCSCRTQSSENNGLNKEYIPGENEFRVDSYGLGTRRDAYGATSRSLVPEGFSNGY